ncbi:Hypothetical protein I5071_46020 [Sandaracinus amylolyticus]|nr:Hypothetical protein I5071_46020 [Sandaracinus amylolyticus]
MLGNLDRQDRLRLMKFVCSFAWADLRIADQERSFVQKMMRKLKLDDDEAKQVQKWLELPPRADEVDPNDIPREHRALFLEMAKSIVGADGEISEEERENLALLEQLLS